MGVGRLVYSNQHSSCGSGWLGRHGRHVSCVSGCKVRIDRLVQAVRRNGILWIAVPEPELCQALKSFQGCYVTIFPYEGSVGDEWQM